ncbi:HesB/YadR/YfhF-family protein [Beutenbergia cavernae DSM 12333]|uniref:HesB/YadR/YfhF-family protein n=1 Tax=Beutenbergia cavernae (strain ATCC BAA-8 / DSM 12333 / CCUG 43141 / JCM 11478 / NBRC 16432 / NCIMB 13614 / HKI 0122) TaxID=471853 RepID=C5C251_BEUC1|nr:HesB/YadR/YfhF-family protein [Beutenbergia cavernae]ACQ81676.1 HesB/YadR/YfhF-family protein [Beutenbergia cavernae DSM 12333]
MLTLTENAESAVRGIVDDAGLPPEGGMRIALADAGNQLELSVVPQAQPGDAEIEAGGTHVFVADTAAPLLDTQELDAGLTEQGPAFTLRQQAPEA